MRATLILMLLWPLPAGTALWAADIDFDRDVRPLLSDKCFACHGPDAGARKADLRLDERDGLLGVVVPGRPEASALIERISSADSDFAMPPPESEKRLTAGEIDVLRKWIKQGARYVEHWAFVTPRQPPLPPVRDSNWPRNAIDYFVLAQLERAGLEPSPPADNATLARRVTLDLTGLPPTPDEVRRFIADESADAYERLVDRLLASPRYGEHLAAFWLDAARYADTDGYQNDRLRYMHAWRDWLIMALNENRPFDQFVIEQLAGDMLPDATLRQQIATGFCRNHRINSEAGSLPPEWRVEYVVDRVDTLGTVFLGLTLGCARCHEHKYDPVSQKDYYRLFAYFNNVPEWGVGPNNGNSPPYVQVPADWPRLSSAQDRAIRPAPLAFQKKEYGGGVVRPQPGDKNTVMVMQESPEPRETYLLERGQYNRPDRSERLWPAVPPSLNPMGLEPGNRLELARWLTHPQHPLTARVAVNRFWQQLFGTGIVKTSDNFGLQGQRPSHPELLDWLARWFIAHQWDVKALLRQIVTSATYRQSSHVSETHRRLDPDNRLLSRGPRRRLSGFVLRDQALAASGLLVERIGGPSVKPYMPPNIWKSISNNRYVQDQGAKLYRRSLYTYWRRTIPPPTMMTFNAAARETCTVQVDRTNTPLQALSLMNNITFVEASRFLAERMLRASTDREAQLAFGLRLICGRPPRPDELEILASGFRAFRERFAADPEAAERLLRVGEKPCSRQLDRVELAAMSLTASLLLNLDETVTQH